MSEDFCLPLRIINGGEMICDQHGMFFACTLQSPHQFNIKTASERANLIVKAVNAHAQLVAALMDVMSRAQFELTHPTEMRDTAFSLILKSAEAALASLEDKP